MGVTVAPGTVVVEVMDGVNVIVGVGVILGVNVIVGVLVVPVTGMEPPAELSGILSTEPTTSPPRFAACRTATSAL
jgi:hypothetical protein